MDKYYAMITPGQASDWGEVILIHYKIANFIEEILKFGEDEVEEFTEEDIEEIKSNFTEDWEFIKNDLYSKKLTDKKFILSIVQNWDSYNMSENYYLFKDKSKSSIEFNSITDLVKHVIKNKIELLGDLT